MDDAGMLAALGRVSDRLVGGMMFHSDHADLAGMLGLMERVHEDGYLHDAKCLRKVRRASLERLGSVPGHGDQRRPDGHGVPPGLRVGDIGHATAQRLFRSSLTGWHEWECETARVLSGAADDLAGDATLWALARDLQEGAESEASEALRAIQEMEACGWDMAHAYERFGRNDG